MDSHITEDTPSSTAAGERGAGRRILGAVESYALRVGVPLDSLLEQLNDLSDQPTLGGPECLTPLEVAEWCTGTLPPARAEHLSACEDCRVLVKSSTPDAGKREEFLAAFEPLAR